MNATILVIDDEDVCLDILSLSLSIEGFKVLAASSGLDALNILKTTPDIDLILLDLMMPAMHGNEVLKHIKSNPITQNIPVLVQTGTSDIDEIKKSLELGAMDYITKPFIIIDLVQKINDVLQPAPVE